MRYIVPTVITHAMLISSSVAETDYTAWNAATAYVIGDRAIRTTANTHSIYERLVSGTTATAPEADPVNWFRVGPTNRWAMLDGVVGTSTSATSSIAVTIAPGRVRALALLDMDAESVTVDVTVDSAVIYSHTVGSVPSGEDSYNWFDYFFGAIERRRILVLTDLPAYEEAEITITVTGSGTISVGSCVVGMLYELGTTLSGASVGIIDYSRKDVDDFGAITIAERAYSKRMTVPIAIDTSLVDIAAARLARIRATPVVWIGAPQLESLTVYGFLRDWSVDIPGMATSTCSLEIEGLT